jgi:hypothetical protein
MGDGDVTSNTYWFWMRRAADALETPPAGDVVLREPPEG